ncbi:MAG: ABC transporter permease [Cryobacterium sp.]|nr:ABC transporter permease [Cryobacterium sp.]
MNTLGTPIRAGLQRGAIEFRNSLQNPADLGYYVVGNIIFVIVILLNRNEMIDEIGMSVPRMIFPGVLAMILVFVAAYGLATVIATEREDGTLLRAKSLPGGMTGYVWGQIARTSLELAFSLGILIVAGTVLIAGLWEGGILSVASVLALSLIGLLACVPIGFVLGSVFKNPRSLGGWGFIVLGGLIWISGLFMPLIAMPEWVQALGQVFPLYWLGLGMRAAMLPDSAVAIELAGDWRVVETFAVLGVWAVVGLLLAPVLLRRMARRESGSAVEARRHAVMQKVG